MGLFFLILIILYLFLLLAMKRSWDNHRLKLIYKPITLDTALIIPFRNECGNLPTLLLNLEKTVPPEVELIFIDDKSQDGSYSLVERFLLEKINPKWHLIKSKGIGKKAALSAAIGYTQAEVILATDADCRLPEGWITRMLQPFQQDQVQLAAGPVMAGPGKGFFGKFQQIEWASILLLTQYFFSLNKPSLCSAANLAYRRSAFLEVEGFLGNERHLSGDDEFLLKKISGKYGPGSVVYIKDAEALVMTRSLTSLTAFLQQRIRWASKWRLHGPSPNAFAALMGFGIAVVEVGSIALVFGDVWSRFVLIAFWAIKIGGEKSALGKVLDEYKIYPGFLSYFFTSFVHPFYVLCITPLALVGRFSWKGRIQKGNKISQKPNAPSRKEVLF